MRNCGPCQTCCTVAEVVEGTVNSPAFERCSHQCSAGCDIYESRPKRCADFNCSWMRSVGADEDRPDLIGAMIWIARTERGLIGFAVELAQDAIRTTARDAVCRFVKQVNLPLVVVSYGNKPPHDIGDRLVLCKQHVIKAAAMRGPLIETLSDDVSFYELNRAVG